MGYEMKVDGVAGWIKPNDRGHRPRVGGMSLQEGGFRKITKVRRTKRLVPKKSVQRKLRKRAKA